MQSNARAAEAKPFKRPKDEEPQRKDSSVSGHPNVAGNSTHNDVKDETEVHLNFEPKRHMLPYEATVGRPGQKVQRLRSEFRKREAEGKRLREAEEQGCGQEVRNDLAMQKAMLRARGEK